MIVLANYCTVVQELGREGVLPFSSFFASDKPFNTPFAGLFMQWLISAVITVAAPPGDAYLFLVNCPHFISCSCAPTNQSLVVSYPLTIFNLLISGGLLLLYTPAFKSYDWSPPFRAWKSVVVCFFLSNIFLAVVPMIPPSPGFDVYERIPYWVCTSSCTSKASLTSWHIVPRCLGMVNWFDWYYVLVCLFRLDTQEAWIPSGTGDCDRGRYNLAERPSESTQ